MNVLRLVCVSAWLVGFAGCSDAFTGPRTLGGIEISAEVLNQGMTIYRRDCSGCHGLDGKGKAPTSPKDRPPRDLTIGFYKFGSVPDGGLPTDEDLIRVVRGGLSGTQMDPHPDLDQSQLHAVVQYVKTLSPRWATESAGKPVAIAADPWAERRRLDAIARGFVVYHTSAQCWTCHPAYARVEAIETMVAEEAAKAGEVAPKSLKLRSEMGKSAPVETRFGIVLPPDFLGDRLRAAKGPSGLYRAIAAGVGGTPMPAWSDRLGPEDLWALVYYIQELSLLRGLPGAARYREGVPGWDNPSRAVVIPALTTRPVQKPQVP